MRQLTAGLALLVAAAAWAQAPATPAAPASAAAAAPEPRPDDTTAQRAKSQPGNNAPFWRAATSRATPARSVPNVAR
jgi:formate dehydrogenase subunit gamma